MPVVPMTSPEQYGKALEVLDRVGGSYAETSQSRRKKS